MNDLIGGSTASALVALVALAAVAIIAARVAWPSSRYRRTRAAQRRADHALRSMDK